MQLICCLFDCTKLALALIVDLDRQFLANHVMGALGIVLLQYCDDKAELKKNLLRSFDGPFCHPKHLDRLSSRGSWVSAELSTSTLGKLMWMFKMNMKPNSKFVLVPPLLVHRATRL